MDYTHLFKSETSSKIGIIGATKGYGYTLLAQIVHSRNIQLRVICSRHSDECLAVLTELGYDASDIVVCSTDVIRTKRHKSCDGSKNVRDSRLCF